MAFAFPALAILAFPALHPPPVSPSLIFLAVVLLLAATALHKGQMALMALPTWPTLILYAALLLPLFYLWHRSSQKKRRGPPTAAPSAFLNQTRQHIQLRTVIDLSHDTKLYRFALPGTSTTSRSAPLVLGLPTGKHIKLFAPASRLPVASVDGEWNGRPDPDAGKTEIERKYTPTSSDLDLGVLDLVIKVYGSGVVDRFPDGGKMSQ